MAERLRFDRAAPRRLRNERLPEPVREELSQLWDGVVADVYDEVAGLRRYRGLSSATVERVLRRVGDRVLQAERVIIFAAVHYPLTSDRSSRHVALAGVGGASAAAAEELALFGSVGTATAAAILTAVVGEVFETYVAASARTRAYQRAGRSPDPDVVLTDLAEAAGYATSVGRRATPAMARDAAALAQRPDPAPHRGRGSRGRWCPWPAWPSAPACPCSTSGGCRAWPCDRRPPTRSSAWPRTS